MKHQYWKKNVIDKSSTSSVRLVSLNLVKRFTV
jgi:hypothetical protein